jgi:hypothetical protein
MHISEKPNKHATLLLIIVLCATLGLAPFSPEPHLFGKIRWVLGGAKGMALADWWDLIMHGAPFLLLALYFPKYLRKN